MENDRIAKKAYVGECAVSRSVGRPWKRWNDTAKEYLKKSCLGIRRARRMVHERSVWRGEVCEGNTWGIAWRMNP